MKNTGILGTIIAIIIIVALFIGECKCIYKAIDSDWDPIGKREIIYTGSALVGLGSIVGYINIQDTPATPKMIVTTVTIKDSTTVDTTKTK